MENQLERLLQICYSIPTDEQDLLYRIPTGQLIYYDDLKNIRSPHQLFPRGIDACILFYPNPKKKTGHWTILLNHPSRNSIEFFDPYGLLPDDQFDFGKSSTTKGWLSNLLDQFHTQLGITIEYNPYSFQELGTPAATCGPWCTFRYLYRHLNIDQFYHSLKQYSEKDRNLLCLAIFFTK